MSDVNEWSHGWKNEKKERKEREVVSMGEWMDGWVPKWDARCIRWQMGGALLGEWSDCWIG